MLSISVIGSTLVVPAFADFKTEEITTSLVNETFDGLTVPTEMEASKEYKLGDNVYLTSVQPENSIRTIADGKFKTEITKRNGACTNPVTAISVRPSAEQTLTEGDKIHINFDFATVGTPEKFGVGVMLENNFNGKSKRFVDTNNKYDKNTTTVGWISQDALSWLSIDGTSHLRLGNSCVESGENADMSKGVNIDVVLNPYDAAQGNEQTVKITYKYKTANDNNEKTLTYYAKYDGDYTGANDLTFDKVTSLKGLKLQTIAETCGTYTVDNVVIEKLRDDKTYYVSTVKNLIDYDFSKVSSYTSDESGSVNGDRLSPVDQANNVWFNQNNHQKNNATIVNDTVKGNVFKQEFTGFDWEDHSSRLVFVNPEGTTNLDNGDIIRFSYDAKLVSEGGSGNDNQYAFGPQINIASAGDLYLGHSSMQKLSTNEKILNNWAVGTDKENVKASDNVVGQKDNRTIYRDVMLTRQGMEGKMNFASRSSEDEGMKSFTVTPGEWHSYEYIINTADPAKDGKQTMKVYVDKGTANEQILYNTLDLNVMNEAEDKFTKFTGMSMVMNGIWPGNGGLKFELYSTNYKLDVIKPGIGLSGDAIKDHDPEAAGGIKLEEGSLKIDVNLNVPGTVKKSTEEAGTGTVASIYVAQYDEKGLLKDINVLTTDSGEFTQSNASISRTIQVKSGVEQVKIFGFDGALRPIFTNVVGGVVKVNPQNISFNSENGVDSSQH